MNKKFNSTISIIYNYMMSVLLTLSQVIFQLFSIPYISRVLEPAGVGQISFATSIINNFLVIAQLGIPTYGIRECAKYKDDKEKLSRIVQELLFINLIMCIISYVLLGITLFYNKHLFTIRKLILILSSNILITTLGTEWLYRGLEKYMYIAIRTLLFNLFAIFFLPILVNSSEDVNMYAFLTIFANGANVLNFIHLNKIVTLQRKFNIKRHIKSIVLFCLMTMAITVYTNLDMVMIGFMRNDFEAGYYNIAIKMKVVLVKLIATLGTILLPKASYLLKNDLQDKFIEIAQKAIHMSIVISFPLAMFFIVYAKESILLLSGDLYLASVLPMQILMPTLIFIGLTNILGMQVLVPMGKEKKVVLSVIIGAITDLIINLFLIPQYGVVGASVGTLVAEIVVLLVQIMSLRKIILRMVSDIELWKIAISAFIAAGVSYSVKMLELAIPIKLIVSFCVFIGIYLLVLYIFREKLCMVIKSFVSKKLLMK